MYILPFARSRLLLSAFQKQVSPIARAAYAKQYCLHRRLMRLTCCNARTIHNVYPTTSIMSHDEYEELMSVWPEVVRYMADAGQEVNSPEVSKWLEKMMNYTVTGGKYMRPLILIRAYKILAPAEQLTEENLRLARILGWCAELVQSFLLLFDDIQDQAYIRRDQPCWFRLKEVGYNAVNDGVILENSLYRLLKKYFKNHERYLDMIHSLRDVTLTTMLGQCIDLITNYRHTANLDKFTMDSYNNIVCYKTAYYSFVLPVNLAMLFAGMKKQEDFEQMREIMCRIGRFFQIQDDYINFYRKIDKISTDVQEGKCSWMIVEALQHVTPEQRKILEECFGSSEPEKARRVMELYYELDLPNLYLAYERKMFDQLSQCIKQLPNERLKILSQQIMDQLINRLK